MDYAAEIVSARRSTQPTPSYVGRWTGSYVVRNCVTAGWPFCYPEENYDVVPFELTLTQSGSRVAGELVLSSGRRLPVTGEIAGGAVVLAESVGAEPSSGGGTERRLSSFSARLDEFGRLKSTVSFRPGDYFRKALELT